MGPGNGIATDAGVTEAAANVVNSTSTKDVLKTSENIKTTVEEKPSLEAKKENELKVNSGLKVEAKVTPKTKVSQPTTTTPVSGPSTILSEKAAIENNEAAEKITTVNYTGGLIYKKWNSILNNKPVELYVLEIPKDSSFEVRPMLGEGSSIGRGNLTKMVKQANAAAGINTLYFDSDTWIVGNFKIYNDWVAADATPRTALALYDNEVPKILASLQYTGYVENKSGERYPITGMNRGRYSNEIVWYNNFYGTSTGTNDFGAELQVDKGKVTYVAPYGNTKLLNHGFVLSGHGNGADFLRKISVDSDIKIVQTFNNADADRAKHLLGAGPLLVSNSKVNVQSVVESIPNDIARGRAPRTAIGIRKDGTVLLVVVDGRSTLSAGVTLNELAEYLVKLGAETAMNLDGGGSSEMVIGNEIKNIPSDGHERQIRAGLGVFLK